MQAANRMYRGVLTILTITSVSSVYVRTGSNITDCSMKCSPTDEGLQLYRVCGDEETCLRELSCKNTVNNNVCDPRLHLNTSSGCWTLTDAGKDDSCVYYIRRHNSSGSFKTTFPITVLDPVLIYNITSNSSRPGEDIAVRVQFSGEETAVTWEVDGRPLPDRYRLIDDNRTVLIPSAQIDDDRRRLSVRITNPVSEETREYQLEITDPGSSRLRSSPGVFAAVGIIILFVIISIVLIKCKKKMKPEDVERNENNDPSEEHGRLTSCSSETDRPREEKTGEKKKKKNLLLLTWIHTIWRNPKSDQTAQREEAAEMETSITHTEERRL